MDLAKLDRTWLCTVLFMDIVNYSMNSDHVQATLKTRFTNYLSEALRGVADNDRLILDTGDGAAVCFLGAPEPAMFTALTLRASFTNDALACDPGLKVRIGINLGPVKLVRDINGSLNAIGDGINTGQRVMSFAGENQVLVSRSFFEVVSCLADDYPQMFRYEGVRKDKHVREHIVYQLVTPGQESLAANASLRNRESTLELVGVATFDQKILDSLSNLLAHSIGPIAHHLVKRAAQQAKGGGELVRELAECIPQPADRAKFLAQGGRIANVTTDSAAPLPPPSDKDVPPAWDAAWLEKVRQELATQLGPMARVLIDRAVKHAGSRKELCELLSAELPPAQRKRFFAALGIAT